MNTKIIPQENVMSGDRLENIRVSEEMVASRYYDECVSKFLYLFEFWANDRLEANRTLWSLPNKTKMKYISEWRGEQSLESVGIELDDEERFFEDILDYHLSEPPAKPWDGIEPLDIGFNDDGSPFIPF